MDSLDIAELTLASIVGPYTGLDMEYIVPQICTIGFHFDDEVVIIDIIAIGNLVTSPSDLLMPYLKDYSLFNCSASCVILSFSKSASAFITTPTFLLLSASISCPRSK